MEEKENIFKLYRQHLFNFARNFIISCLLQGTAFYFKKSIEYYFIKNCYSRLFRLRCGEAGRRGARWHKVTFTWTISWHLKG